MKSQQFFVYEKETKRKNRGKFQVKTAINSIVFYWLKEKVSSSLKD